MNVWDDGVWGSRGLKFRPLSWPMTAWRLGRDVGADARAPVVGRLG